MVRQMMTLLVEYDELVYQLNKQAAEATLLVRRFSYPDTTLYQAFSN
jgi:hypothetical protein